MLLLPFLWLLALLEQRVLLLIFVLIYLAGDIIDGYVARKTNTSSKLGALLDSVADWSLALSAVIWSFLLMPEIYTENLNLVITLAILMALPFIFVYLKFKKLPLYHLYSNKITVIIGFTFFLHALVFNYDKIILYLFSTSVIINTFEKLLLISKGQMNEHINTAFSLKW